MGASRPRGAGRITGSRRVLGRLAAALGGLVVGGLAVLAAPAAPADAHATVVATDPTRDSVIGYSPTAITVTFSEPVTPIPGRVQVLAPDGKRISGEEPTVTGGTLRIPVRVADRPLGTYLVSYRVVSADSHPVSGGFTFSVGAPSATAPEPPRDTVHPSVRVAVPVAKYLGYAGLVLTIGPALLLGLLWPATLSRRGPIRLVRGGLLLIGVATVAAAWLQAPYRSGAALTDVSGTELRQVLGSGFGAVLGARLGVLLAVAALLPPVLRGRAGHARIDRTRADHGQVDHGRAGRGRAGRPGAVVRAGPVRAGLLVVLGVGGLVTWPLLGHAIAAPVPVASIVADVIHLLAMAVWLGGLVTLLGFALRAAHPRVLAVILPVWSRWATIAVVWLVAGGLVQATIEIGAPGRLLDTGYGRLVLAKAALLGGVLGAAWFARRLIRRPGPAAGAGTSSATAARTGTGTGAGTDAEAGTGTPASVPAGAGPDGRRWLRRTVAVEVGLAAVILGFSAVLVQTTPARTAGVEAAATSADGFAQTLTSPLYTLQFDIYPVRLGEHNTVHAYVYTPDGQRLPVVEWQLTAALPERGVEPVTTPLLGLEPHHAVGAVAFPVPGEWQLRFTVRISEIDQASVTTRVRVD